MPNHVHLSAWLAGLTAGWVCSWGQYLTAGQDDDDGIANELRRRESTGRPLGDRAFVQKVRAMLGRELLPRKRGPKTNLKADDSP